jgi:glucose-6-phosphate 1-dehydrogenase
MEAPISFDSNEIRNKKLDVLHAIRPIHPDQIHQVAVRGQYGAGWIGGTHVAGYRSEPGVVPNSTTETFAAVKLFVDNWRWQGVPFYLRTGKRVSARISEISIHFRPVPHQTFPASALLDCRPNRLLIAIQPEEGILLRFEVKQPGPGMYLTPVMMQFYYREAFKAASPEAYETLLLDVMRGDATLFMRADQTEAAWSVITPILDVWESVRPTDFPNYQAGTWGPEGAEILTAQDGRNWVVPTFLQCREDMATCEVIKEPPL